MVRTLTTSCYMFQRDVSMCHLFWNSFLVSKKWKYLFFNSAPDHLAAAANTKFKFGQKRTTEAETKPNKCQMDITNIMFRNFRSTVKLHHRNCALPWTNYLILQAKSRTPEKSGPAARRRRPFKRIGIHLKCQPFKKWLRKILDNYQNVKSII